MDQFVQALQHLLPQGYAWPRDRDSVLMRLLQGLAAALREVDGLTDQAMHDWLPNLTVHRLEEWEAAVGLPDACLLPLDATARRRALVLSKLQGVEGYYEDSSQASPWSLEALSASMGFPATVRYNTPFRVGRDRVGRRVGRLDGVMWIVLHVGDMRFRVSRNRVGDRLLSRPPEASALACYLGHYAPARFELAVIFSED